jgi:glutamyl-tRNA reductase
MSVLVVGLSHRTAPIELLERTTLSPDVAGELAVELCRGDHVIEAVSLVTCNRLEVYAEVSKFHGGVGEIGVALAKVTGVSLEELTEHLYVHYEGAAVAHLFRVTCGLESMAVGEAQILGQVRTALRAAQNAGSAGRTIGHLVQTALRVGKRAHTETRLDRAGPTLVEAGLKRAAELLGPLDAVRVLVLGAGAMSGLSVASAYRAAVASIAVSSRTTGRAERLAASVDGVAVPLEGLPAALVEADLVIACAGSTGYLVTQPMVRAAQAGRRSADPDRAIGSVFVDLALPRDVEPSVAQLPGVSVFDLEQLGRDLTALGLSEDLADVRSLVSDEVAVYLADQRAKEVAPTVVALRAMARTVVETELRRLESRVGSVDPAVLGELEQTVHRVVEKLLHVPTVRVKELAAEPGGDSYAEALRLLFNLGLEPIDTVAGLPADLPAGVELSVQLISEPGADPIDPIAGRLNGLAGRLRLGTRRSPLARTQSHWVANRLGAAVSRHGREVEVELVEVTTHGDLNRGPVSTLGGTGVFVSALRDALLSGKIDFAVHSLKDLPTGPADGLVLAALPLREDPRDVLIARDGLTLAQLPAGATVGTGSTRRAAQLRALGLGLEVVDVRGNVDTRLRLVADGKLDAIVLARAGLIRLGRAGEATEVFDPLLMLPAPGQGALAVEARAEDLPLLTALGLLDDPATRASVLAERSLLARLEAGCSAPVGALAEVVEGEAGPELSLRAVVGSVDGAVSIRRSASTPLADIAHPTHPTRPLVPPDWTAPSQALTPADAATAIALGRSLAEQMLEEGAAELIPVPNPLATAGTAAMAREGDS